MGLTKITSRILDSSGVTILGTIATGVWEGTAIADDHIASAATWNTASTDRLKWDGGATGLTASTGRTSLGLGTVATTAASDYATAAQGTKADSAQQPPSEGAFANGDKTKLDAIEASADVTDTTNVTSAGALMDSEVTNLTQVKAFDSTDYATSAQGTKADTAHGWGNHTSGGYVKTTTDQTIGGTKTFSSAATFQLSALTNPSGVDSNTVLTIKNNGWSGITMLSSAAAGSFLTFGDADAGFRGRIQYLQGSTDAMVFETAASEKMRITSGGNVGIGTTLPAHKLSVNQNTYASGSDAPEAALGITIGDYWTTSAGAALTIKNAGHRGAVGHVSGSPLFRADFNNATGMILDKNGNLGIGTASPDKALVVNHSADGNLITFEKDEALVGAIGTFNGVPYIGYQAGAGGGIMFNGLNIEPTGLGTARTTGTNNLGTNNHKFKDIYISDGIYFNSNSSNNHLDDYEEGVFSPVYSSDNGTVITNLTAQTGHYVKVGKLVHISGSLRTQGSSSTSGVTGNLNISGLPFNSNAVRGQVTFWTHETGAAYNAPAQLPRASPVQSGAAKINIYKYSGSGGRTIRYLVSDLNMSGNSNFMHFSGTYEQG